MRDVAGTLMVLVALTLLHLCACDDTREPRTFYSPGVVASGGGSDADPCDPLPDECEPGDRCSCRDGAPGEPVFYGVTHCDITGAWTECLPE